jgi:hypothetical protein
MRRTARGNNRQAGDDELLNEQFNTLLRDAADKREERSLVQANGDAVAAREESADLLALARSQGRKERGKSKPPAERG